MHQCRSQTRERLRWTTCRTRVATPHSGWAGTGDTAVGRRLADSRAVAERLPRSNAQQGTIYTTRTTWNTGIRRKRAASTASGGATTLIGWRAAVSNGCLSLGKSHWRRKMFQCRRTSHLVDRNSCSVCARYVVFGGSRPRRRQFRAGGSATMLHQAIARVTSAAACNTRRELFHRPAPMLRSKVTACTSTGFALRRVRVPNGYTRAGPHQPAWRSLHQWARGCGLVRVPFAARRSAMLTVPAATARVGRHALAVGRSTRCADRGIQRGFASYVRRPVSDTVVVATLIGANALVFAGWHTYVWPC